MDVRTECWLRFHPRCWYRPSEDDAPGTPDVFPALIAAVTDEDGSITGCHRTWLAPDGSGKAPIATPRRAMGDLLGMGVRFGNASPVMLAGEGLETMLSLRNVISAPAIAGLSAPHLAAVLFPADLHRLYVARDDDPAGTAALATLTERATQAGIDIVPLEPQLDDFNSDLRAFGREQLAARLHAQLRAEDAECLMRVR
ncbi:DUF7146 domain-containing protein [Sphingomonas nostoxanthinifaciens]|uniref:DUF7146 domain-containing protein n=1 Tax=Sphingomonas nostoxanthinifaciens TaxID=2872652 RepID=UPI002954A146|nr:toprim domain-containing protein [Sphingomonas nostoxanthinifaciens]